MVEFIGSTVGTTAHKYIRSWKWRLRGTIITKINGHNITTPPNIDYIISDEVWNDKQTAKIEFGSLTAFAINGAGVPTLQTDQLNVITHHLNAINTKNTNNVVADIYKEF